MDNRGYFLLSPQQRDYFDGQAAHCNVAVSQCFSGNVTVLEKERALLCLGCKDGLIASAWSVCHERPNWVTYLPFTGHIWAPDSYKAV